MSISVSDMERDGGEDQVSMTVHDYETTRYDSGGESSGGSGSGQFKEFAGNGMVRLEEDDGNDSEHGVIKKSFLVGMGLLGKEIEVVAVHKNSYSSVSGQAKLEAFRIFCQAVAAERGGDANIKYGWYGGSRDEICDIISYGFGRCGDFEKGVSHGIGVYLSPANVPVDSALRAKEDENGVRHMLLCRVILGNTETVCAGSEQFQPSSTHFDSGIDNPLAPRKYIIWSAYMNSHIFPNYIISFTAPSLRGNHYIFTVIEAFSHPNHTDAYFFLLSRFRGTWDSAKKPNSPSMKFPMLLNVLSRLLHPSKMGLVLNCYNDFREHKICRSQLIRRLRNLVGDKMLISVIKLCGDELHWSFRTKRRNI
ncbi:hypothetical protein Pfo_024198 [Paulownia fortunei]|nr:hypothetical protein Pfo_024198 [Paulownia fortunei]